MDRILRNPEDVPPFEKLKYVEDFVYSLQKEPFVRPEHINAVCVPLNFVTEMFLDCVRVIDVMAELGRVVHIAVLASRYYQQELDIFKKKAKDSLYDIMMTDPNLEFVIHCWHGVAQWASMLIWDLGMCVIRLDEVFRPHQHEIWDDLLKHSLNNLAAPLPPWRPDLDRSASQAAVLDNNTTPEGRQ